MSLEPQLIGGLDSRLPSYRSNTTMLAWLIEMFHDLAFTVTASDVGHRTQLETLDDLGCDTARGDYLAHPMTPAAAGNLFNAIPPQQ